MTLNRKLACLVAQGVILAAVLSSALQPASAVQDTKAPLRDTSFTIVVLGSSTSAGAGAYPRSMSWVNRYGTYLSTLNPANRIVNLAIGGYTTYHILPTGSVPPEKRPAPDTEHNITQALAEKPDAIIINMPSNDVGRGYTLEESSRNVQTVAELARAANVPLWVTTSQPRGFTPEKRLQQAAYRDFVYKTFGDRALDFWTVLAEPDGNINPKFDSGDHVHTNNLGHAHLFRVAFFASIPETLYALKTGKPIQHAAY